MKIAATYDNGNIFQHFGKTEFFKVYEVEDNKVVSSEVIGSNGTGHGALAGLLAEQGISVLICGGIGGGAQSALAEAGIELCSGAQGDADAAVEAFSLMPVEIILIKAADKKPPVPQAGSITISLCVMHINSVPASITRRGV